MADSHQPPDAAPRATRKRFVGRSTAASASASSSKPATAAGNRVLGLQAQPLPEQTDPLLEAAIKHLLPANYNFEIQKSVNQIKRNQARRVALQLPEGLAMYACSLVDIIERFADCECVIMGDVTYGACCIDDYSARALGCDMMIHYGHSCLVPVDTTTIKTLYVFVEIAVDRTHLAQTVRLNFPHCIPPRNAVRAADPTGKGKGPELEIEIEPPKCCSGDSSSCTGSGPCSGSPAAAAAAAAAATAATAASGSSMPSPSSTKVKLAVVGTIQFVAAVQGLKADLDAEEAVHSRQLAIEAAGAATGNETELADDDTPQPQAKTEFELVVPQVKPLSPGEILGCTAPRLEADVDALLYVGDGRFHLESIMIANPLVPAFRYDPYTKRLTRELYDHEEMRTVRGHAVAQAKESLVENARKRDEHDREAWAVVLGTLGRQGNLRVLKSVTRHLEAPPSRGAASSPSGSVVTAAAAAPASPLASTPFIPILLSELSPAKLSLLRGISTFVQTSCPRLSIDWGYAFPRPLLSPYEASVALGVSNARGWKSMGITPEARRAKPYLAELDNGRAGDDDYPMDFYADGSLGEWTPRFGMGVRKAGGEKGRPMPRRKRPAAAAAAAAEAAPSLPPPIPVM
ncbi:hypothetical protein JCM3774_004587 [Rhodotorula dairenensis]